ncbi:hypothetical protein FACS1894216_02540 [Synergistales bacterium]|nr:hypothetical protein FACS1894216_02540 [Synergistales bacterium]
MFLAAKSWRLRDKSGSLKRPGERIELNDNDIKRLLKLKAIAEAKEVSEDVPVGGDIPVASEEQREPSAGDEKPKGRHKG